VFVLVSVVVLVDVDEFVDVEAKVMVGKEVEAVTEVVDEEASVGVLVSVPKTPIGITIAVPGGTVCGVRIESFHAGGVRISLLTGSMIARCCLTYESLGFKFEFISARTLHLGIITTAD
jgi:hypothetical protein